jgi:hypothetical protein
VDDETFIGSPTAAAETAVELRQRHDLRQPLFRLCGCGCLNEANVVEGRLVSRQRTGLREGKLRLQTSGELVLPSHVGAEEVFDRQTRRRFGSECLPGLQAPDTKVWDLTKDVETPGVVVSGKRRVWPSDRLDDGSCESWVRVRAHGRENVRFRFRHDARGHREKPVGDVLEFSEALLPDPWDVVEMLSDLLHRG